MKLVITMPLGVTVDDSGVSALVAEDSSGRFEILPHHADLLAVLVPSIVAWRKEDGAERFCAIHGGVLTMSGGEAIAISTRDAVTGDNLDALETEVLARFQQRREEEKSARAATERMILAAVRQIIAYVRPQSAPPL